VELDSSLQERVVAAIGEHYELAEEIGRGGMSVVYRARDRRLNRAVAIKVLPPELAYDPAIRLRFTREAQTSAQLAHAHIVPIYDVGDRDGIAYFVMPIIAGGNLAALLANEPHPPLAQVRAILTEVADALAYAHLRGVIHRDIKPDNVLLDADSGRAMVTDFGIARAIEAGTRLTVTGNAIGTPTYMSPEQAMGEREVDGRSDLYSLGVLGYQMLTGRVPFTAGNSMALLLKHVSEAPRPIADLRPEAPRGLREVIERAMQKAPDDRWPTATAMRDALRSGESAAPSWRPDNREPVRYQSPRPESRRPDAASPRRGTPAAAADPRTPPPAPALRTPTGIVMEPEHLASLTTEQREDLRLWKGRVNLLDRISAMRFYTVLALGATAGGIVGFIAGFSDAPPLVVAPVVPIYIWMKWRKRAVSLRQSGLRLRRVLFMPSVERALQPAPNAPSEKRDKRLEKLATREVLEGAQGTVVRRAAQDAAAILDVARKLPKGDRALLGDLESNVNALVARVAQLAQMLHRLDQSIDPKLAAELDARIAAMAADGETPDDERRIALLRRQRATVSELAKRRVALARQLESAGLALGNLRLDMVRFRSSGQSSLSNVSSATQEVRALSRDIDAMLEAVAEVKDL
jgi:serine/threonine-protein kinase